MNKRARIATALAVASLAAVASSAYTQSFDITDAATTLGYGQWTVTGGVLNDVTYQYSNDGTKLDHLIVTVAGDTTTPAGLVAPMYVNFTVGGVLGANDTTCGVGVPNAGPPSVTVYDCNTSGRADNTVSGIQKIAITIG